MSSWFEGVRAAICLAFISNLAAVVILMVRTFTSVLPAKILWIIGLAALGISGKLYKETYRPYAYDISYIIIHFF